MKQVKLYNVIFPIWLILFFPPVIFITLAGNFIIDSLIIIAAYFLFKPHEELNWFRFYKSCILKVWVFGFIADIIGAALLFACAVLQDYIGISDKVIEALMTNPFNNILATLLVVVAMVISSLLIIFFNHQYVFSKLIDDELTRWKVAGFLAITTLPWTFLIPTSIFI
ncbi:MAG: hypothetical protein ACOX22_06620 [Caldicoprobacterales bacterium]|jgi:hypothetical protein|nr:hypothetical protein [Clostridiales bacterium]